MLESINQWWNLLTPLSRSAVILVAGAVVFWVIRCLLMRLLNKWSQRTENDLDDRLVHFASRFYGLLLFFVLLLAILKVNGIEITPLLASAGIAGIALGLAAKETLADVVDIGLRRTLIRNTDGVIVNYPNAVLANSVITNFSFETDVMRVRIRFQVPYDTDLALVRDTAVRSITEIEGVVKDTAEIVTRSLWDDTRG